MKKIFIATCILFSCAIPAQARVEDGGPTTIIEDKKEAELLFGRHLFSDHQRLIKDYFIKRTKPGIVVAEFDPTFKTTSLYGQHQIRSQNPCDNSDLLHAEEFIQIDGYVSKISKYEFEFEGTISILSHVPHSRTGKFIFSRELHPTYWSYFQDPNLYSRFPFGQVDIYVTDKVEDVVNYEHVLKKIKQNCKSHAKLE